MKALAPLRMLHWTHAQPRIADENTGRRSHSGGEYCTSAIIGPIRKHVSVSPTTLVTNLGEL
jgi:hypothetical protein